MWWFFCAQIIYYMLITAKKGGVFGQNIAPEGGGVENGHSNEKNSWKNILLASAPLHTQDTEIGLGALVWQPQLSFSISDRSCLMAEKSRQNASRIARQKMKTGCERHGEREREQEKKRGQSNQAWPNKKDNQMLPIWTVRLGLSSW